MAATSPHAVPPQDALDKALPFLTGLFGALAAYVATAWQARVTAGRADRDALGVAATEFCDAVVEYARQVAASLRYTMRFGCGRGDTP